MLSRLEKVAAPANRSIWVYLHMWGNDVVASLHTKCSGLSNGGSNFPATELYHFLSSLNDMRQSYKEVLCVLARVELFFSDHHHLRVYAAFATVEL